MQEATGRLLSIVAKAMNDPALDEDGLTRIEHDVLAIDAPGRRAVQPVNGFVPPLVIVGDGHARVRLDGHFERIEAAGGLFLGLKKPELEPANADCL